MKKYIRAMLLVVCCLSIIGGTHEITASGAGQTTTQNQSINQESKPAEPLKPMEPIKPTIAQVSVPAPVIIPPPHEHEYHETKTNATCTNDGYITYACNCGDTYTANYTQALGHNWKPWTTSTKATWFKKGKKVRNCTQCNLQETRDTNKLTIANSGTIQVAESINVLDYLIEPEPEDFGKYYDNAVLLYNAFLSKQEDWLYLFFSEDTYELEREEWEKLRDTFEKKCFQNCGVSIYVDSYTTGAFPQGSGLTRINIHVIDTIELYNECCKAIRDMGLYTGMSQYEAVYTINEWMRNNIVYELQHWSPLDVLQTGKAQCAGYAYLFQYLCKYTGIETKYVTGCTGHEDGFCGWGCHAWNRVKLADKWYYLDICWNDSSKPNRYYLTPELWAGRIALSES